MDGFVANCHTILAGCRTIIAQPVKISILIQCDYEAGSHNETVVPTLLSQACSGSMRIWQLAAWAWLFATARAIIPEPVGRPCAILCIAASAEVSVP